MVFTTLKRTAFRAKAEVRSVKPFLIHPVAAWGDGDVLDHLHCSESTAVDDPASIMPWRGEGVLHAGDAAHPVLSAKAEVRPAKHPVAAPTGWTAQRRPSNWRSCTPPRRTGLESRWCGQCAIHRKRPCHTLPWSTSRSR